MQKVFVSYRLKSGVTLAQYEAWSTSIDQQITPTQPACIRFEVYAIEGTDSDATPYCDIIEDIEVDSWEAWEATLAGEGMSLPLSTFPEFVDLSTVVTVYGTRIVGLASGSAAS